MITTSIAPFSIVVKEPVRDFLGRAIRYNEGKETLMSVFDDPPLHDFPDRAIRRLLAEPANLRDLIAALLPDLVERFDFGRVEAIGREFLLEDWRRRES